MTVASPGHLFPSPNAAPRGALVDRIREAIPLFQQIRYANEIEFQDGIAFVLYTLRLPFRREYELTPQSTIDFLVSEAIGLEVKIKGGATAVGRQLERYAAHPTINALVLLTTRNAHRKLPAVVGGKPLTVVHVAGGLA